MKNFSPSATTKYFLCCCIALGCHSLASAKGKGDKPLPGATDSTAAPSSEIGEVVVTGQYAAGTVAKAVHRIRVVDRKRIDALNAQNLRDVLQQEMNVRLSQDNILGSSMSIQGVSGQNVKILIDGVPVLGRQDGNIDISQINLFNIERIEIVEGPMSVSYGTDALAGTINLITRKTQRYRWEGNLVSYNERIGTYNLNAKLGWHHKKHTLQLNGGRNLFDGWSEGEPFSLDFGARPADNNRVQQWKPKEQYMAGAQYSYRSGNTTLTYRGDFFNENIVNRGQPDYYGEHASDDYYRTRRMDHALYLSASPWEGKNISLQLARNDYRRIKNTYAKDLTTLDETLSAASGAQDTSRFGLWNARGTFAAAASDTKLSYEAGYDLNLESATGVRLKGNTRRMGDYAVFASLEYHLLKGLTLRPGLRYAYNTDYTAPLIPSLNLRYRMGAFTWRGSYARGFRAPSLKELYMDFHDSNHDIDGNPDLKAEYSDNYNISLRYAETKGKLGLQAEVAGFYNDIRDRIDMASAGGTFYKYVNIGRYKTQGLQMNAELTYRGLKIGAGFAYTGRYNALSQEAPVSEFSYTPEASGSIVYEHRKSGATLSVFGKYTGRMPGFAVNTYGQVVPTSIAGFGMADVALSRSFLDKKLQLAAGCKNIFDVRNINRSAGAGVAGAAHATEGSSLPYSTGRNWFLKAEIKINSRQ